jgi:hypothetical protein
MPLRGHLGGKPYVPASCQRPARTGTRRPVETTGPQAALAVELTDSAAADGRGFAGRRGRG